MNLGRKITLAKQAIDSILKHDDEPVAARVEAAEILSSHIAAELAGAQVRENAHIAEELEDPTLARD